MKREQLRRLMRVRALPAVGLGLAWMFLLLAAVRHPVFRVAAAALLVAVAVYAALDATGVLQRSRNRRLTAALEPAGPPIEEIAAALRQLLWDHDEMLRSPERADPAGRLRWLERRIGDRAVQAARAIDVRHPNRPMGGYSRQQLGRLLHELACAGLVLPRSVVLLAPDNLP
ncbi:hypothetical protein ACWF0M_31800 [Kribbella sp. NPDC055110]